MVMVWFTLGVALRGSEKGIPYFLTGKRDTRQTP
jgi:hypothetical protein